MISRWMYALVFAVLMNAQPASLNDVASERALSRFMAICDAEGKTLWGRSLCGPIAIVNSETRWTIANEQDPENKFKQKSGGVYAGLLPAMFATANTAFDWGSRKWTMVLSPLPVDPYSQVALITHEAFHRIQDAMTSQPPTSQMRIWTPRTDDSGFAWNCGHWRVRYGQRLTRICARASPTR